MQRMMKSDASVWAFFNAFARDCTRVFKWKKRSHANKVELCVCVCVCVGVCVCVAD